MNKIFDGILLVSDIDGTFVDSDKKSIPKNLEAVKYFTDNGGLFTFATGRFEQGKEIKEMAKYMNAPAICANGASLYDFQNDELIYSIVIDGGEIIDKLLKIKETYPEALVRFTYSEKIVYIDDKTPPIDRYDWYKVVIDYRNQALDEIREDIETTYGDRYYYSKSEPHLFEILDKTATKGTMITYLRGYLDGKYNKKFKVYAIGDFENDIPMLQFANFAVCPENALPIVKAVSDIVVCDHNIGAVADLIYKIEEEIRHG